MLWTEIFRGRNALISYFEKQLDHSRQLDVGDAGLRTGVL
jgi:hypothetical protein